ncbi:MAG TPA: helix-turn-helix transcriptional regulator [Vineibacter sp.]|nr:helix-turn-helix transcriptional regulator [Vineibacter sp.]
MLSTRPTEKLLDLIYDAATEPDAWRLALTQIADLTRSQGGVLFGQSMTASRVYFDYNGRLDPACNRVYQERHMRNPWSEAMEPQPVGHIVLSDDVVPLASLRATAFFDEVLAPQDLAHNAMIALAAKADFRAAFNLCRSARQGPFGASEQRLLNDLMPHLRRSITLGFRIDAYRALQRAEYHVLDHLAVGVVLLDRRAQVLYANAAARRLDSTSGAFRLRAVRIEANGTRQAQQLNTLIRAALLGKVGGAMSLPRSEDGRPLTVLVSSVRGLDMERFTDMGLPDAAALLFFIDPANNAKPPIAWLMNAYGLTAAEAKVALVASSGMTVPQTADHLGLSTNTVKTHLRRVFAKTGTGRQADLARLTTSIGLLTPTLAHHH